MQRRSSPSMRPIDNGAWRCGQRSSNATMPPSLRRYSAIGSPITLTPCGASAGTSWLHAATYQRFFTNVIVASSEESSEPAERDARHRFGVRRLVADAVGRRRHVLHRVRELAEAGDLDVDDIAGLHR